MLVTSGVKIYFEVHALYKWANHYCVYTYKYANTADFMHPLVHINHK